MFHVALYQPEIPPNTGNIIRLCANTGCDLHLIHPLGFSLDERRLRRAGLDYHEWTRVHQHTDFAAFRQALPQARIFAFTTKGRRYFHDIAYQSGDILLFGPETRGLPAELLSEIGLERWLRIPMAVNMRSLNLANAAAVAVYEAWRQHDFRGAGLRTSEDG